MKIRIEYFSLIPQVAGVIATSAMLQIAYHPAAPWSVRVFMLPLAAIHLMATTYCAFCMEKGLTVEKILYYEKTALLWESVAEELRKEGKFACLDTFADTPCPSC